MVQIDEKEPLCLRSGRSGSISLYNVLLLLLFFKLLFLRNIRLHLGFGPAFEVGLAVAGDAEGLGGDILGDGAAGGGISAVAHLDGSHEVGIAANEAVVADLSAELILAVVIAGDGAAAKVAVLAHIAVANVGQVADGVAPGEVGVLGLDVSAQMHAVIGDGVDAHMGEGPDVVVGAQMAAVHLAGVDGGALVDDAVFDQAVGADDASGTDDRFAPQDGARQNDGARGDLHVRRDLNGAAVDDDAVGNVAQQDLFPDSLGGVQLCACGGEFCIHKKYLPQNGALRTEKFRHKAPEIRCNKFIG